MSSKRISSPSELGERASFLQKQWEGKTIISVCSGPGCKAYGGDNIFSSFEAEIRKRSRIEERESLDSENSKEKNSTKEIIVRKTGCHGWCEMGPVVTIYPQEICYFRVKAEDVSEIVEKAINNEVVERLLYHDEAGNPVPGKWDIPFYKYQKMLLLRDIPKIDPTNIEDYIRLGGYQALARALFEMTPEEVLEEVKKANLRGRGGGGFPAGIKWETTRKALGSPKYVIVNADEGDPGAYMDRAILEGNPHSVIEGLIIGAYAIGSNKGFIYIRQEYPYTLENVNIAIRQAMDYGFLGKDILGSGFDFEIKVHRGAGAYVSGESSALTSAIEGNVGEPRLKYIHMAESGLWGKPTNLNNVETWANVPLIIKNGADWFTSIGTKNNSGTKIFSMVGKVKNTGLVEVPLGISLRDIIFKIGGGIKDGKKFKAVQTGGPSGGVIPEKLLDLPVDFDKLSKAGSMMGSGGMVVMDETSCMVNVAYYFLNFLSDESCGKCVPCREGLRQMLYIYERIINGNGRE
ncbi:MAG: SLBB domain-containing protein, partial [Actinobacteria bacterium]|nr:SLBB domain-containing protein [Actinomycetota bacterium]